MPKVVVLVKVEVGMGVEMGEVKEEEETAAVAMVVVAMQEVMGVAAMGVVAMEEEATEVGETVGAAMVVAEKEVEERRRR